MKAILSIMICVFSFCSEAQTITGIGKVKLGNHIDSLGLDYYDKEGKLCVGNTCTIYIHIDFTDNEFASGDYAELSFLNDTLYAITFTGGVDLDFFNAFKHKFGQGKKVLKDRTTKSHGVMRSGHYTLSQTWITGTTAAWFYDDRNYNTHNFYEFFTIYDIERSKRALTIEKENKTEYERKRMIKITDKL